MTCTNSDQILSEPCQEELRVTLTVQAISLMKFKCGCCAISSPSPFSLVYILRPTRISSTPSQENIAPWPFWAKVGANMTPLVLSMEYGKNTLAEKPPS